MPDALGRRAVETTLTDGNLRRVFFTAGPVCVSPMMFLAVHRAVTASPPRIAVERNTERRAGAVEYYSTANTLWCKLDGDPTPTQQALIVHECTHAGCDLFGMRHLTTLDSEVAAYLAQIAFFKAKFPGETLVGASYAANRIFRTGLPIAERIVRGEDAGTAEQLQPLRTAILHHPSYEGADRESARYDGV